MLLQVPTFLAATLTPATLTPVSVLPVTVLPVSVLPAGALVATPPPALVQDTAPTGTTGAPTGEEGATEGESAGLNPIFLVVMMVAIFWFVVFAPERKNRKRQKSMLEALKKGDKVMTTSGLLGTIVQVMDDVVVLQVDEGVRLKFTRAAVQSTIEPKDSKATEKNEKSEEKEK